MTFRLPDLPDSQPPKDMGEMWRRFFVFASNVVEFMRLTPSLEYKDIQSDGTFPIYVKTRAPNVYEVRRVQSFETKNSSNTVDNVHVAWRASPDPKQPGIYITQLGGVTAGTQYTVRLAIHGSR